MLDNLLKDWKGKFGLCVGGVALLWNLLGTPTPSYAEEHIEPKQEQNWCRYVMALDLFINGKL